MKYVVKPSYPKGFCYDVSIFSIEREVFQKNIEKYRNTPLKKFKLDTIYLLATVSPGGVWYWFYFVIIPVGSWYKVGILPLIHNLPNSDIESKYVTFSRYHINDFGFGDSFGNLDYNSLFKSLKYLLASKGQFHSETIIFPIHPHQEFLFMNWKENPFEVK